jgi:hypothetical protein
MKYKIASVLFWVLIGPILLFTACNTNNSPTVPPANVTYTPTNTGTPTSTKVATVTKTPTQTATSTVTTTPPMTATNSPTNTVTATVTATTTSTPTSTPLTPISGGYTFNSSGDTSGWGINIYSGGIATGTVSYQGSPINNCWSASGGALQTAVTFSAVSQKVDMQYNLAGPTDFHGMPITLVASIANGFVASAQYEGQLFVQDGSAQGYAGYYSGLTSFGSSGTANSGCVTFTGTVPSSVTGGFDPTQVTSVDFEIDTGASGTGWGPVTVETQAWVY